MYQNLFTGRIVQNVTEFIIVFITTITSKYVYQLSEKTPFYQTLETLILKKLANFLCLLELWGLLFIKFEKSSNERRYGE